MSVKNTGLNFEDVLNSTVRMVRTNWKAALCLFLQLDDKNQLRVRAGDGLPASRWRALVLEPAQEPFAGCIDKNQIVEIKEPLLDGLHPLLKPFFKIKSHKFVLVPVYGQTRVLGALLIGPFAKDLDMKVQGQLLRNAGTLCAVLAAYGRLYEWMSNFLPQMNHELRTPLTAVQGSLGMVLGGMFGQLDSEVRSMLEMAHKGCARTIQAIEEHLTEQQPPKA